MLAIAGLGFEKGDVGESVGEMAHDVPMFMLPIGRETLRPAINH